MNENKQEIMNKIILKGDISTLSESQKLAYYGAMCDRIGIDPMTQPFQLLKLQGKEVLYCTKSGAEQLNKIHKVSHEIRKREETNNICAVEVRASMEDGEERRFVDEIGAVKLTSETGQSLTGDAYVNAIMKAVTKAKRRATLSLLGLGMLDETETETIPNAIRVEIKQVSEEKDEGKFSMNCIKCGKELSDSVFKYSVDHYSTPLCFEHQKELKEKLEEKKIEVA